MFLNTPLVSVCIPAYRSEKYIRETIDCLLKQTYQNLEIIVIIDGAEDDTENILKSIADHRLKYLLQSNKGAAAARNTAYKLSKGEFIKFMDADDLINPECIELQLQKLGDNQDCIVSAKWGRFYTADRSDFKLAPEKIYKDLRGIDWLINSLIYSGANMMQPGIFLIPRAIIEKAGLWNEALSLIDDFEYMVRIISGSEKVYFCEGAVLMYRSGLSGNLSGEKSALHMNSAYQSLTLGIERILEVQNDTSSRLACANIYQKWAYQFYPDHLELCNKTEEKIKKLGGSDINLGGGDLFILLSKIIGWKSAKKLKMFFGRV